VPRLETLTLRSFPVRAAGLTSPERNDKSRSRDRDANRRGQARFWHIAFAAWDALCRHGCRSK